MTLTFLFADIRDYTSFVEQHGDAQAGRLIAEFRRMVRAQLAATGGGEVKTEGDSFYLVFRTAMQAVQCGAAILQEAELRSRPDRGLRVGVGIHAGEPIPLERQYVGSAVNLAARIGSAAESGELLISDTVRGLLRTSGLPPLTEHAPIPLKGIQDVPRIYSVDWHHMEFMSAGEARPGRRAFIPEGRARVGLAAAAVLVVVTGLGVVVVMRDQGSAAIAPGASATPALPSHGVRLFEADLTPAGSARAFVSLGSSTQDRVRFTGDAMRFEVSAGSWAAISVGDLAPDDFVGEFVVRLVSGDGSMALFFHGTAGRQDQVVLTPSTGEVTIQVSRSFQQDANPQRLFGPASRVPPTREGSTDLVVSARGREVFVFLGGSEIARATDSVSASGAIGVVANAARNQSLVIELRALRLYNP